MQNAIKYSIKEKAEVSINQNETAAFIKIKNKIHSILTEQKYNKLGEKFLLNHDNKLSKGLFWAREGIEKSNGILELIPFETYKKEKEFSVIIKLIKQL